MSDRLFDAISENYLLKTDRQNSSLIYYGRAKHGALGSEAVWQIRRYTKSGNIETVESADGGNFTQVWDDRTTLFPVGAYFNSLSTFFDGVNQAVHFGDVFLFDSATQWSLSMWVKPNNLSARRTLYAKATDDVNVYGWGIYQEIGGVLFIQMRAASQTRAYTGLQMLNSGVWNHVVITYNGNQNINGMRVFVNGVEDIAPASGVVTNTLLYGQNAMIGARNSTLFYSGNIDEVSFWDKALSAAEVTQVRDSGSPNDVRALPFSGNLLSFYRMGDGDVHPTVVDLVDSRNGTMINMSAGNFVADVP